MKEYFGITAGQTLHTWSVMETLISVVGLIFVLLLGLVVWLGGSRAETVAGAAVSAHGGQVPGAMKNSSAMLSGSRNEMPLP